MTHRTRKTWFESGNDYEIWITKFLMYLLADLNNFFRADDILFAISDVLAAFSPRKLYSTQLRLTT